MKYFPFLLYIVIIVTVAAENVAPVSTVRDQNTKRIDNRLSRLTGDASTVDACAESYSPCTCELYSWEDIPSLHVSCTDVASFESVQTVFRRTTANQVKEFILTIPSFEDNKTIPANLLSGKAAQQITLNCPSTDVQLTVDPNAFNSSEDFTDFIKFSNCDLSRLDYTFTTNFNVLREISYSNSIHVSQWPGLPTLPSLRKLSVDNSPDFKDFKNLPVSRIPALSEYFVVLCPYFELLPNTTAMKMLKIESCPLFKQWDILTQQSKMISLALVGLDNQAIQDAMASIVSSPSVNTLVDLTLTRNGLTQVPAQIELFTQLQSFVLSQNNIAFVGSGSLSFSTLNLQRLDLSINGLETIEPDAFQGNYGKCQMILSYNSLRRLESSVFKSVLEQIESTDRYGFIEVYQNPIECDCHLDWLFVDNNHLVDRVTAGQCSNGTYFSSLTTQDFSSCKSGSSIPTTTNIPPTTPATETSHSHQLQSPFNLIILLFVVLSLQK